MAKKTLTTKQNVCFVQFLHPGGEHTISKGIDVLYPWNYKAHRRKFLETTAQYIGQDNNLQRGEILFWGEWEPESLARTITPAPANGTDFPRNIHNPLFITNKNGEVLAKSYIKNKKGHKVIRQNTDPFVFGKNFYYSICQQGKSNGQIKNLANGSIILFGSKRGGSANPYFALDTVFVVADYRKFTTKNYKKDLKGFVQNEYPEIMGIDLWEDAFKDNNNFERICCCKPCNPNCNPIQYTCYQGASYSNPIYGMYSFVPCVLSKTNPQGFERIKLTEADFNNIGITIPKKGIFNNKLNQHFKITITNIQDNKKIWDKLRKIVHQQNCLEGVQMDYRHIIVP